MHLQNSFDSRMSSLGNSSAVEMDTTAITDAHTVCRLTSGGCNAAAANLFSDKPQNLVQLMQQGDSATALYIQADARPGTVHSNCTSGQTPATLKGLAAFLFYPVISARVFFEKIMSVFATESRGAVEQGLCMADDSSSSCGYWHACG